jgi:hypothetical protein
MILEFSRVRVKKLLHPVNEYDVWTFSKRPPQIGDIGTVVDIKQATNLPTNYVVECTNSTEGTVWLCDLNVEEIEVI